jgi:hypothetical protein
MGDLFPTKLFVLFVAYLEEQRYVLGKTDAGVRTAVREALQLCRESRVPQGIAS